MTKSQKKILSRLKKEIKNFFSEKQEGDKVYFFIKQVEQLITTEEAEYKERKRKEEKDKLKLMQLSFDDYKCKWETQYEANMEIQKGGDIFGEENTD